MSAQSGKKKRYGLRRRGGNQNQTSEPEFQVKDSTSVVQASIPERYTESLNILSNPEDSLLETKHPPSPELTGNRRKLGSSHRSKGRQHVKDSVAEPFDKPQEEVEENMSNETLQTTQLSLAIQPERQAELSRGNEDDLLDVANDSSFYSVTTPGYSIEVKNPSGSEFDVESLIPKNENLQAEHGQREADCKLVSDSCQLGEIMQGGMDKTDTFKTAGVSDQLSDRNSSRLHLNPTVDQQLIEQSLSSQLEEMDKLNTSQTDDVSDQVDENLQEMPNEELPNVDPAAYTVNKERDEDTELLSQHGNVQVSESHVESKDVEFSTTPEMINDKTSLREITEIEHNDEQATLSLPTQGLSTNEEIIENFNLSEVKDAQHSDDAINKMHAQDVGHTQMQEMHQIDYSSESVVHDATEKSENLIERAKIKDIHQSELIVKTTDDSSTKQDVSNPDDKQDEGSIKESNMEALEQGNGNDNVSNTKEPSISNIEPCQVYEGEGQVEDNLKPSAEQTVHQVIEGILSDPEECKSSLQTQQSEINAYFNSQPQDHSMSIEEQTDNGFNPVGNRRKMGSSRRNRGRRHIKDPVVESYLESEEVVGNTMDNAAFEAVKRPSITEATVEEKSVETMLEEMDKLDTSQTDEVSDQVDENVQEMPNEELPNVDPAAYTVNKERDEDTELLSQHGNVQVSESHVESKDVEFSTTPEMINDKTSLREITEIEHNDEQATLSLPTQGLSTNEEIIEHFNLSEVKDAQHSDDAINKMHAQDVGYTQMQEMHQIDYSSESVVHDATEKSENLIERAKIKDIHQSELIVKTTDDSSTKQDVSNPDDKQDEGSIKESNMEALEQGNGNDNVSNTKEPSISNIEPCQVYEGEGQVEDNLKPSAEQTVHQVIEGILSDPEECKSSLQTQQSEINAYFNSQPQDDSTSIEEQTDNGFNPVGNRRKMGSSRRNRGRRHIKDPDVESYLESEEVVGNTMDNAALEAVKRPSITEATVEEKSVETMLEEMDKLDTSQTDEVSDQVDENLQEMPNEELPNVDPAAYTVNKERDEDTELLSQHGNVQVSESHVESEDVEFSTTPEIINDKTSLREITEIEHNDEQATLSLPTEVLSTTDELKDHLNLSEVKDVQHSEDAVNEEHKQEVKPTQMEEIHQNDYSSESVVHDVTEKSDTRSENLIEQAEVRDTYQSELSVKTTDDSSTKQDVSNPNDKQDEGPIKESNMEALDQRNEDDNVSNTKEPLISNIEPCQVYEGEGQVEDDLNPSAEQSVYHVMEGILSDPEECKSSLQTQQSEINAPLDSQPQDDSMSIEEQTDNGFNPIGNRRKMGSSRINRGRRHIKDPVVESYLKPEEVVGNTMDNAALEAVERPSITEATVEEKSVETMLEEMDKLDTSQTDEVSDQVDENLQEMPNEERPNVDPAAYTVNKERDEDTELLSQHGNVQVSESHVESKDVEFSTTPEIINDKTRLREITEIEHNDEQATLSLPTQGLSTNEELKDHLNLSEVKDVQHSEDAVNEEHKQEVKPTQLEEMHQNYYSSESVVHDVTEKSDTRSENLIEQAEVRDTYQSELSVKTTDDSSTKQDISNPDDKQDESPIKESNMEALDQRNEDDNVSNTKEPLISNIEPCQVYEGEGQVEDDLNPSAEQSVYHVMEGILSDPEECKSSLQTQQSEINAPLDSQLQDDSMSIEEQTDNGFNPVGNRRKMGSSRINRGRRHIKDPVVESYLKPEEVVGNTMDNAALEAVERPSITEATVEEKSVETMLEEMDKLDTSQTDEVSDQVDENLQEMPNEERPNVDPAAYTVNKERDEDTELLSQHGNVQVSESHVESKDVEFSTTPEIINDKTRLREITEIEHNDEQATLSLPTQGLSTNEELKDHLNLSEVKDVQHSEDAVNEEHKQEVKPTQLEEMHQNYYSSESVVHDVTEKSDTRSENLIEQAEVRDTYQSELSVKTTDDSSTKQDVSNPDDKQDEGPIKESNMEALDQRNEDDNVSNTKEPLISNIEPCQVYEGEGQVEDDLNPSAEQSVYHVMEGILSDPEECKSSLQTQQSEINAPLDSQLQDDSMSIEEQTDNGFNPVGNRRKMGSSRINRGRRHIKDPVVESYLKPEEVVGNTMDNAALEAVERPSITEATVEEKSVETMLEEMDKLDTSQTDEVSDQVDENLQEMPNEELPNVDPAAYTVNKERDEDTELLSQHGNVQVSESHVESEDVEFSTTPEIINDKTSLREITEIEHNDEQATLSLPTEVLSTTDELKDHLNLSEVKDVQHSEDAVNEEHKQEIKPTQMEEIHQNDYSSESVVHDVTEKSDTRSENLIEQAEVRDTYQSELSVKTTDDSSTKQDVSNPNDKQDEGPIKESNMEALDQRNEDDNVSNTKEPLISNIEPCQVYEGEGQVEDDLNPSAEQSVYHVMEGILSDPEECKSSLQTQQSEINAPLDSQPQDDSMSIEEQTDNGFNPIGNRRKMGSSRINRGRRHIKDPVVESYLKPEEVVGNTMDNAALEAVERPSITEATVEEKSVETMLEEMDKLDTSQTDEVSDQVDENLQEMPNEERPNVDPAAYTVNKERDEDTELLSQHGNVQVSESHVESKDVEFSTTPEIINDKTRLREITEIEHNDEQATLSLPTQGLSTNEELKDHLNLSEVKDVQHSEDAVNEEHKQEDISNPDDKQDESPIKESNMEALDQRNEDDNVSNTKEPLISNIEPCQVYEGEGQVEDDLNPSAEQSVYHVMEGILSDPEECKSSLQTQQSEINAPLDSQLQDDSMSIEEQTDNGFNPVGNRRKMGSSRINRGRRHIKDPVVESYLKPEEVVGNTMDNAALEAVERPSITEATVEEKSVETMLEEMDKLDTSQTDEVSDQVDENLQEMPNEERPNVDPAAYTVNKERDEDTELLSQHGNVQVSESHVESKDVEFSTTPEIINDKTRLREITEIEHNDEQATLSLPTQGLSTNEELKDHLNLSEVKDVQHSEDAVNEEHKQEVKPTQLEEMHQNYYSSESVVHDVTEKSDTRSENLIEQAEVRDTYQSELSVKTTDDSSTKQDISNPDDKQDEGPIKESNMEALDQRNEDDNVSNTKEPLISNIEPCQVYEGEGQVEDDLNPSAEQSVYHVMEGILSDPEECKSSLQTQQSEINAPLDSQLQDDSMSIEEQTDNGFNPVGNRRKMGSSRINRGRRHIKDPVVESYLKPEEVVGNTMDNAALEAVERPSITEATVEEKSVETMLEEMDKLDTSQTDEVSDQVDENLQEMPNEERPNVDPAAYTVNKERDEDTELLSQHGNVQ
ncbi:uncharacterized protein LOC121891503, partial [Scomber scombrus]